MTEHLQGTDTTLSPRELIDCICRIGRLMEHMESPQKLLRSILDECKKLLRCEVASLALVNAESSELRFVVAAGGSGDWVRNWNIPSGKGIVGAVAGSGIAVFSNDVRSDPRWYGELDERSGFVTRNLAAAPMRNGDGVLGVLEALNRIGDAPFAEHDLALLQIFADQAATAICAQRLIEAKAESDRLAGIGIALADIGHSVKNMIFRLKSSVGLIDAAFARRDWDLALEAWGIAKRANLEINALMLDMLTYSKARAPILEEIDIAELIEDVVASCRNETGGMGIELRMEKPERECRWAIDERILRPALMNLAVNAIEALEAAMMEGGCIEIGARESGDLLRLWVRDNGPGIPDYILPHLYMPFFTHGKPKGTGLGLANVRKGVEEHGGRIELKTSQGNGATFTMLLPRQAADDVSRARKGHGEGTE